jgi:DNA primase small subunit
VLEHTYPRLDTAVSQKLNHLLKSPFVVHPGTGRICVPIDTGDLEGFDPLNVPTLQTLVKDIDLWTEEAAAAETVEGGDGSEAKHVQDWEKTSLKPYIDYFRSFVTGLMKDEREIKREAEVAVKREREEVIGEDDEEEEGIESLEF